MRDTEELLERIWERDPTIWTGRDEAQWLGWLDEPLRMIERTDELRRLAESRAAERVVVVGMGGSSLAPLVLGRTLGLPLEVVDTTHPAAVRRIDTEGVLFVISSKSGSTVETRCHFDHLWHLVKKDASRFLVITDPGSPLEQLAAERGIEAVAGEPTIGGRYSALSVFGLVPAAVAGADLPSLLARAEQMHDACRVERENPGLELGLELGARWLEGRDKVVFDDPDGFGLWLEQLLAESTGKEGKGLVPVRDEWDDAPDRQRVTIHVDQPADVAAEFFRFELATAVAGAAMEINPFDQPDVEDAKARARAVLSGQSSQTDPEGSSVTEDGLVGTVESLLASAAPGDYIAIQAFIDPVREAELAPLVERARRTGCVVTVGLGPRFLHSTGQLHKGGPPSGLFIQVADDPGEDVAIPKQKFGFRRLIEAQAAGDFEALVSRGRRVVQVRLEDL
jgi:hypothetical protein